jgi:phage terminase small subunit
MALNKRQCRFVQEYLVDLNGTQAAIRAGYSAKTAAEQAFDLLRKPQISAAITGAEADRAIRTGVTQDRVIAEMARLGFANMLDYIAVQADGTAYVDLEHLTRDQAAAIAEMTVEEFKDGRGEDARDVKRVKIKLADKLGPLTQLGRHTGLFPTRMEHSGPGDGPIEVADARERLLDRLARRAALRDAGGTAGGVLE